MRTFLAALGLAAAISSCFAADDSSALLSKLKEKYPNTSFNSVSATPINGLYEVIMGKNIGYTDINARYIVFGGMFDLQERVDMTAAKREASNRIDWAQLPLSQAIEVKKGKGSRVFALFTDPDCPYCKRIERTLAEMDDYTAYVFPFPIASLHPSATEKAVSVWCAKDKAKAWSDMMLNGKEPSAANCANPISENVKLASAFGINGTPTMIRRDGKMQAGALPREALESWLSGR